MDGLVNAGETEVQDMSATLKLAGVVLGVVLALCNDGED